ncbi:beat-VI [Sergentomyia squamirostris]
MGNAVTLSCQYDLEKASLYAVRWYFEKEEFYSYVPKESPPERVFPVSGISVDLDKSDKHSVTLRSVSRELTGQFECEVSEDAPLFHTAMKSAHMMVIELPKEEPIMQIDKKTVAPSGNFKAACSLGVSFPPANITWYINGRRIYKTSAQRVTYRAYESSGTFSTLEIFPHSQVLQAIFKSNPQFQHVTVLSLLCEVSILNLYHKSVSEKIVITTKAITTISPNLLGLEAPRHPRDPDNSALIGHDLKLQPTFCLFVVVLLLHRLLSL